MKNPFKNIPTIVTDWLQTVKKSWKEYLLKGSSELRKLWLRKMWMSVSVMILGALAWTYWYDDIYEGGIALGTGWMGIATFDLVYSNVQRIRETMSWNQSSDQ